MYFYCVLPRSITKESMNAKHVLLLAWSKERIGLLDDVLSKLAALSGFDTVEYDSSAMGNLFMVTRIRRMRYLKENPESSADL